MKLEFTVLVAAFVTADGDVDDEEVGLADVEWQPVDDTELVWELVDEPVADELTVTDVEPTGDRDRVPEVVLVKEKLTDSEGTDEPDGALTVELGLALPEPVNVGETVAVVEDDEDAVDEIVWPSTVKVKLDVTVPDTALVTEAD